MNVEIIECKSKEDIERLGSALTWEGMDMSAESLDWLFGWVEGLTKTKRRRLYLTKGATMNRLYGLTGDNAYPDDLNIVSIMLDDMEDWNAVVLPRFQVGGRWMDDIVQNNISRERGA